MGKFSGDLRAGISLDYLIGYLKTLIGYELRQLGHFSFDSQPGNFLNRCPI